MNRKILKLFSSNQYRDIVDILGQYPYSWA